MAKIQISFQDNSDNEEEFKIYRKTSSDITTADTVIATLTWSGTEWTISGTATNAAITQSQTTDPSLAGHTVIFTYDETTLDTFYYGVSAKNIVGESGISVSSAVVVAS